MTATEREFDTTASREFDIVLYGATGFVGKLTADYERVSVLHAVAGAGRLAADILA